MSIEFEQDDLNDIVSEVCASLLEFELEPVPHDGFESFLRGRIDVQGETPVSVTLDGNEALVHNLAVAMFESEQVETEAMNDAWAELTNMVGGNLKCLLDSEKNRLSLPQVVVGADGTGDSAVVDCSFGHGPHRLRCRVFPR